MHDEYDEQGHTPVDDRAGRIGRAVLMGSMLPLLCLLLAHALVWPYCGPPVLR